MNPTMLPLRFVLPAILAARLSAQQPALPTAEQVLDRYVAVTGGQAAYDRVMNRVIRGAYKVLGATVARNTEYVTRGGSYRNIITWPGGLGDAEQGLNDGIAWMKAGGKSEIVEAGPERALILRSAVLLSDGQWRAYYSSAKTTGVSDVAGKRCYKVEAELAAGGHQTLYYEVATGLLVRHSEEGAEVTAEEYAKVDGILVPRRFTMSAYGVPMSVEAEVHFNQALPESTFALPPEVARLARKRWIPPPAQPVAAAVR